jgi:hypothetical protein
VGELLDAVGDQPLHMMSTAVRSSTGLQRHEAAKLNDSMAGLSTEAPPSVYNATVQEIEAKLNRFKAKPSSSESSRRLGAEDYKLEKMDPRHRVGMVLWGFLQYYKLHPSSLPFFQWLDSLRYDEVKKIMKHDDAHIMLGNEKASDASKAFMNGVEYLDAAARVQYAVELQGGCMVWQDRALQTAGLKTVTSGKGWAIWVMAPEPDATFYTNSHTRGEFHHSSFLSGKSVGGAGEWLVTNGKLKIITGKTGHYRCDCEDLARAIAILHRRGVNVMTAKVKVWGADKKVEVLVNAWEFMNQPELRKAYRTDPNAPEPTGTVAGRKFSVAKKGKAEVVAAAAEPEIKDSPY